MNLQAIILANVIGFLLIAFLFISRFITRTKSSSEERVFTTMIMLAMIACIVEPVTFVFDGRPGALSKWIVLLGNTYLYYANGLGAFFFTLYVERSLYHDKKRVVKYYYKFAVVVSILLAFLFLNLKFGYFFYVDENNLYHRQPLIYIFYIYIMFCAVLSVLTVYRHKVKYGRTEFFPVFMYLIPIVTGSVLQMVFYGVSLAWIGTAGGIVALYMSLQNQKIYIDSLTNLFNRMYLEHYLFSLQKESSKSFFGIMIDMNYFKEINDTYGHSAGDRALKEAADIFKANVGNNNLPFRFAGDEFIIIIKTDDENEVIRIEERIKAACENFNKSGTEPFKLSLSMGHSRFDRENDTEDSFLKRIDDAMYADKERIHAQQAKA